MTAARNNEARFVAACAQGHHAGPVFALYRRLVRGNVSGVFRGVLPRTADAIAERLDADVDVFLAGHGARTAHARDVPFELVAQVAERWEPWVQELARLELAEFRASYAERTEAACAGDLALDAPLALRGPLAIETFEFAVQAEDATVRDPHALLLYRDAAEDVRTLRLTAVAHGLLSRALSGAVLQDALTEAVHAAGLALDETILGSTAHFLDDLTERGIVLGAASR